MDRGPFHRIREVRLREGVSMRSAARRLGITETILREQESPLADLKLSDLRKWRTVLGVPIAELITDVDDGDAELQQRSKLVLLMKTAMAIHQTSTSIRIQRMAAMMIQQLVDTMPELSETIPWHDFGNHRGFNEMGRIAEKSVSDDLLDVNPTDD